MNILLFLPDFWQTKCPAIFSSYLHEMSRQTCMQEDRARERGVVHAEIIEGEFRVAPVSFSPYTPAVVVVGSTEYV